jgi:tRNA G18 (ribose-2'-O)-methylase SpoU
MKTHRPPAQQLRQQRQQEVLIYGENACYSALVNRFDHVIKAFFTDETAPRFGDAMKALASTRKAYKIVSDDELERITQSQHHGGVALVVKRPSAESLHDYLMNINRKRDCILALENVSNPHNLGAIMRSAAHFGVKAILLPEPDLLFSGAAVRTAEGGAETITPIASPNFIEGLSRLRKAGYTLLSTTSHRGKSLYNTRLPDRVVIVFGEEQIGISKQVNQLSDLAVKIPGTGAVESLNVSVATALILGEWWRQGSLAMRH